MNVIRNYEFYCVFRGMLFSCGSCVRCALVSLFVFICKCWSVLGCGFCLRKLEYSYQPSSINTNDVNTPAIKAIANNTSFPSLLCPCSCWRIELNGDVSSDMVLLLLMMASLQHSVVFADMAGVLSGGPAKCCLLTPGHHSGKLAWCSCCLSSRSVCKYCWRWGATSWKSSGSWREGCHCHVGNDLDIGRVDIVDDDKGLLRETNGQTRVRM